MDSTVTTVTAEETAETLEGRMERLGIRPINDVRQESLRRAHEAGVDDAHLIAIARATRVRRGGPTIVLPPQHLETLSRGRGWCMRLPRPRGDEPAVWGERVDGGYAVGAGRWQIVGDDGFQRRFADTWNVSHVSVGDATWTLAHLVSSRQRC
jgi:hypothetical protein